MLDLAERLPGNPGTRIAWQLPAPQSRGQRHLPVVPLRYGAVLQLPALTQLYTRLHVARFPSIEHAHESLNVLHHACWLFAKSR